MEQTEEYVALKNSLIGIASELFRFRTVFGRVLSRLPAEEHEKYLSQYQWFAKRVVKALETAGLRVIDLQEKEYDPGMAVTPMNLDDFDPEDSLYIAQMMEPIIMEQDKVIKNGTVILGRFEA